MHYSYCPIICDVIQCHCMSLCVTVCHYMSLYVTVCHYVSQCVTLCPCVSLTVCPCVSLYVTICLYMSLCVTVCHFMSMCVTNWCTVYNSVQCLVYTVQCTTGNPLQSPVSLLLWSLSAHLKTWNKFSWEGQMVTNWCQGVKVSRASHEWMRG